MPDVRRILALPDGGRLETLWIEPAHSRGLAVLQHGFTRSPAALAGVARQLAESGIATVRPHLGSWRRVGSFNDGDHVGRVGEALAAAADGRPLIGIGHSAGGAAVIQMAAVTAGFSGVLLVDGVDSLSHTIARLLPTLERLPILVVAARDSACNRHGESSRLLADHRDRLFGVRIVNGGHGDIERIGTTRSPSGIYRAACHDRSGPREVDVLGRLIIGWSRALLAGRVADGTLPAEPDLRPWVADGLVITLPMTA